MLKSKVFLKKKKFGQTCDAWFYLVEMLLYASLLNRDALCNCSEAVPKVPLKMYHGGFHILVLVTPENWNFLNGH